MTSAAGGEREDCIAVRAEPGTRLVREGVFSRRVLLRVLLDDRKEEGLSFFPSLRVYV